MLPEVDVLEGKWNQFRARVKARWHDINDQELDQIRSRVDQLTHLLQEKYGYTREKAEAELATLRDYRETLQDRAHEAALAAADRLERDKGRPRWQTIGLVVLVLGLVAASWRWIKPFIRLNTAGVMETQGMMGTTGMTRTAAMGQTTGTSERGTGVPR